MKCLFVLVAILISFNVAGQGRSCISFYKQDTVQVQFSYVNTCDTFVTYANVIPHEKFLFVTKFDISGDTIVVDLVPKIKDIFVLNISAGYVKDGVFYYFNRQQSAGRKRLKLPYRAPNGQKPHWVKLILPNGRCESTIHLD